MSSQRKSIFVVLGMARSGTSTIAKGLQALGIDLGDDHTSADSKWHAKGFWEDRDIGYKINRSVLRALNDPGISEIFSNHWYQDNRSLQDLKNTAIQLLQQRMEGTTYWGFKDPNTAKILPFWQSVFNILDLKDYYVIGVRNPLSSAHSYKELTGCDMEEGLLSWLIHLISAIDGTHGRKRVLVSYELTLQDPFTQLTRMKKMLDIPFAAQSQELNRYANEFLDKNLRHYQYSDEDLKSHPAAAVMPLCIPIYHLLMQLAKDEIAFDSEEFFLSWQEVKTEFKKAHPIYCYLELLVKRNKQAEKKLRTIQKSVVWKMVYPLRVIDDLLHERRRKQKERRRLARAYEA